MGLSAVLVVLAMQSNQDAVLTAKLDSIMRDAATRYRLVGVSAAVVRGRDTLLNRGYGYADLGLRAPATATTRYRVLGPHLATAVMQQVERGRVRLEEDVTPLITDFPWQGRRVTLRQLMDATSGLPDFHYLGDAEFKVVSMPKAPYQLTDLVAGLPFTHEPGASWQWTITGFHMGGALVEKLSRQTYQGYLEKHIFAPAKLEHTHYCGGREVIPELARTYTSAADGYRYSPPESPYPYMAVVCTTAADAVAMMRAMRDGTLLKRESYKALATAEGASMRAETHGARGVGIRINNEEGRIWIGEQGMLNGFSSVVMDFAADSVTVAVLANTGTPRVSVLARNLARAVLGLPAVSSPAMSLGPPPSAEAIPLSAEQLRRYVGEFKTRRVDPPARYRSYERTFRIYEYIGQLMLHAIGEEPEPMYYQQGDTFKIRGGTISFTIENGRAVGIEIAYADGKLRSVR